MLKRVCAWLVIPSLWLVAPVKTELRTAGLKPGAQAVPLIVNEYLADPPGSVATDLIGDANGDGVRSATQDEFVELVNTGTSPVNIGGFTISDATAVRFTFPVGTTIPAGEATVVFGGGTPAGPFGNAAANVLVFAAGGSGLSLNNSADSIIIKSATAIEVARRDYPASDGTAHEAITRSPDITGEFGKHSLAAGSGGRKFSPGTLVNGRPFVSNDPAIASISPEVVVAGAGVVSLTVTGNKFVSGSHVRIDATPLMTMFVSPDELRADVPASVTAAAGSHAITVENPDSSVSNAAAFTVLSAVGINEFLADPPDGDAGDANGDGERSSSEDEFVEIVNRTSAPIDISGFSISDVTQQRFTFPPGSILPAGEAAVVFGGGSPRGEFGNAMPNGLVFTAALSLNNGGDTITLKDAGSAAIETVVYGSAQGNASESVNRSPETVSVALALHSSITESGGRLFSPGTRVDGSPFTVGPRITRIIPDSAVRSTGPLNITVQGTGFEGDSTVLVDSSPVMTRFISASELTAEAPASVAASVGDHRVMVRNVGGNRSNQATLTIIRPAPVLRSVLPRMVESGTSPILFLEGADFDGAVVLVEGAPVPTTLASSTVLSATLSSGLTAALGARRVRVRNVDGQLSNELTVEVIAPGPRILSLRPDSARAGSPGFQMTLSGANYQPGAVVIFDRVPLMTEFVSAAELRADVPASLVEEAGLRGVAVQNSDGRFSGEAVFRVAAVAPIIHSLDPRAVIEGSGDLTITLVGEKFKPGCKVRIIENAQPARLLETVFVSNERVEAKIPAELLRTAGAVRLRVENPDFGFSNTATLNVLIKDPLVINEFLADPPDGAAGDANGDGVRSSSQDEFVEIVNRTARPLDLSGFVLSDSEAVRHVFAPGTKLPPFEAAVVFGGGTPTGNFGNARRNKLLFTASTGGLSLNNGGDTIRLADSSGVVIQAIMFGAAEGGTDQSINRDPDIDGAGFALHTTVAGDPDRLFSPGARATGETFTTQPEIHALSPSKVPVGSPETLLEITGTGFLSGAVALLDDVPLQSTVISGMRLEATIRADLISHGGSRDVRVRNPKGELSQATKLLVVDSPPRIAAIDPKMTGTGAENFEVVLTGERFQQGAMLIAAGDAIEPAAVEPSRLTAILPGRFFTRAGELDLRVLNADENRSNAVMLAIENGPLITRTGRARIKAGRGEIELNLGGLAFKPGVVVFANDIAVGTTFASDTALSARIPAELTASPGLVTLQARNPDGGRSNRVTLRVVE